MSVVVSGDFCCFKLALPSQLRLHTTISTVTVDHLGITAFRKFDVGIWNLIRTVDKGEVSLWGWGKHGILIYIYI